MSIICPLMCSCPPQSIIIIDLNLYRNRLAIMRSIPVGIAVCVAVIGKKGGRIYSRSICALVFNLGGRTVCV